MMNACAATAIARMAHRMRMVAYMWRVARVCMRCVRVALKSAARRGMLFSCAHIMWRAAGASLLSGIAWRGILKRIWRCNIARHRAGKTSNIGVSWWRRK